MGLQTDAARERVAAMTVVSGRTQPAASRDSIAESLVGDREPVEKLLPETRETARENTSRIEGRWALSRVQQFHRDGVRLDDKDATRLLVAVESFPIRDRLWLDMNRGNAASHVALWTDMTKRAPDEVRAAPASLLAFGSWLSGHGAMAWCALDQVPEGKPYALANLVAAHGDVLDVEAPQLVVRACAAVHVGCGDFVGVAGVVPVADESAFVVAGEASDPHAGHGVGGGSSHGGHWSVLLGDG